VDCDGCGNTSLGGLHGGRGNKSGGFCVDIVTLKVYSVMDERAVRWTVITMVILIRQAVITLTRWALWWMW
jgi:hypothetical protein